MKLNKETINFSPNHNIMFTTDLTVRPEYDDLIADLYDIENADYFLKKLRKKAKKTFRKAGDVGKTLVNVSPAGYIKKATTGKDIISPKKFKTRTGKSFIRSTGKLRQRTGQAALAATAGGLAAKKLQTVGPQKKIGPSETGANLVPKLVKPLKGISEEWLPQPGDPTDILPQDKKKGIFGALFGGAKDALKEEVDKIKNDPNKVLNQLGNLLNDKVRQQIAQGLNSDSVRVQQAALDRLAAEKIKSDKGGLNLAGIQMGGNMTWIIVAVLIGIILMAFVFRK